MRILVTGATGFVGTHLSKELEQRGHEVQRTDRTLGRDLAEPGVGAEIVEATQPDYVVHLAARYGRLLCRDEPHRAVTDNASATTELAEACQGIPVLYTSSSEVYGDHGTATITEDSDLRIPTTIYGLSKRWGEEAFQLYSDRLCIVRMNMLYGPEQAAGYGRCALATFIDSALRGVPFTVHRDATRSWLYISDAVRALATLIESGHRGVFNLGNEDERLSMEALAEIVVQAAGGSYEVADVPPGQIAHKNYSSAKLRETIDWRPEVPLHEGIRSTVDSYSLAPC